MKLAGCVVLYNPNIDVFENIKSYIEFLEKLIIVDNSTSKNNKLLEKLDSLYKDKIIYIDNNDNLGIATALNIACNKAISLNFDWILTMDQDSSFINFEHYLKCLESIKDIPSIGLIAANTTRNASEKIPEQFSMEYEEKFSEITSANIVNLKSYEKVGCFDDKLFIDMVDYDFCIRMNIANLKVLYFKDVLVEHALGEMFLRTNLISRKKKYKREHNAQRAYYIARNYLYLSSKYHKKFPNEIGFLHILNVVFVHDVTKILLYESDKLNKIKAKFIALYHFFTNRYGKYNLNFK